MKKKKSRPGMMHSIKPMDKTTICPVCGYDNLKEGPFDEYGYPTYEICPCCGFEFGFSDESEGNSYESYRTDWIRKGFPWFSGRTPKLWGKKLMEKQLENLNLQNQIKQITNNQQNNLNMKHILFIIGSLRKESFNRQLAREAEKQLAGVAEVTYLGRTALKEQSEAFVKFLG